MHQEIHAQLGLFFYGRNICWDAKKKKIASSQNTAQTSQLELTLDQSQHLTQIWSNSVQNTIAECSKPKQTCSNEGMFLNPIVQNFGARPIVLRRFL